MPYSATINTLMTGFSAGFLVALVMVAVGLPVLTLWLAMRGHH